MGGVSWGSVTIGSWLKDEVMMFAQRQRQQSMSQQPGQPGQPGQMTQQGGSTQLQGQGVQQAGQQQSMLGQPMQTSLAQSQYPPSLMDNPFPRNDSVAMALASPNNSAYLADLEANYCRDYSCCGQLLPTLHDLLRHYEEMHIQQEPTVEAPRVRPLNGGDMDAVSTNEVFLNPQGEFEGLNLDASLLQRGNMQVDDFAVDGMPDFEGDRDLFGGDSAGQNDVVGSGAARAGQGSRDPRLQLQAAQQVRMLQQQQLQQQQAYASQTVGGRNIPQQRRGHHHGQNADRRGGAGGKKDEMDVDEDVCIDDPARHLYVEEQAEDRPFKCPVIGCDKNYKNQNGLKYHRLHGHQNQKLRANPDGTYSVIDPESNAPYPEGAEFDKDKPYRCEVCGKRYKNLNGLKYHRGHTTH